MAEGLDIAARFRPASELAGDHYDVIPAEDGCWLSFVAIGGSSLPSGLTLLMLQSVLSALVKSRTAAPPSEILRLLHEVLFEKLGARMPYRKGAALTLVRYRRDGRLLVSGVAARAAIVHFESGQAEVEWLHLPADAHEADLRRSLRPGEALLMQGNAAHRLAPDASHAPRGRELGPLFSDRVPRDGDRPTPPARELLEHLCAALERQDSARGRELTWLVARHAPAPVRGARP
jgi:hypothetical protein